MRVLVIGAAGMVGRKLVQRLAREGQINDQTITQLTLYDVVAPEATAKHPLRSRALVVTSPRKGGRTADRE